MAGEIRIGTSGWVYPHWRGTFYPEGLRQKDRFAYYAERFDTVEINGSFYRTPSEAAVAAWARQAPPGFLYAWKASRFITQAKKLIDVEEPVQRIYDQMAPLGPWLGPCLFQLPPNLRLNLDRLASFLPLVAGRGRVAIEFRHPGWYVDEVFALLERHGVALCIADHWKAPAPWVATAPFVYVRGHGPGGTYYGRYPDEALERWADHIRRWREEGRDVFAYFDNDPEGAAPVDAEILKAKLGL